MEKIRFFVFFFFVFNLNCNIFLKEIALMLHPMYYLCLCTFKQVMKFHLKRINFMILILFKYVYFLFFTYSRNFFLMLIQNFDSQRCFGISILLSICFPLFLIFINFVILEKITGTDSLLKIQTSYLLYKCLKKLSFLSSHIY